jgi:hypothetical protein
MKFEGLSSSRHIPANTSVLLLLLLLLTKSTIAHADAVSELAAFSIFDKVDLAELAKSDVKTAHGPPMGNPRFLSTQSCFVATASPPRQIDALRKWNPTKHRELKVFLHGDLPTSPGPEDFFPKLDKAPDNSSVRALVEATKKMSRDLQISRDEAKRLSAGSVVAFWSDLLASRAKSFVSGGTSAQPPYDYGGQTIRAGDDVNGLLKQQDKIRRQFSGFLGNTGIGRGAGSISPELYWELLDVDDQGVLTLGASYYRPGPEGTYQAADMLYYASGGYYVALTLYQMWPVNVEGKASTLVWRGDMISAASLASLHGVERLASESAMMKDISKAVTLFRRDTSDAR